MYWGFLLGLLGLFALDVAIDYHPTKLGGLFFVLFWVPMLVVHEAGHAVVAIALGWRVRRVVIGMGRTMLFWRIAGVPVEIRQFPLEGFVEPEPRGTRWLRLKNALIYFAGPGAELVVLGMLFVRYGPDELMTRSHDVGMIAVQSLAIVIAVSVVVNLIPMSVSTDEGWVPNDGMGILMSFRR